MYEIYQDLLKKNGVKSADVSKSTGVPNATLSDWKHGKSAPKLDKLQKIADYFNVTVDYLTMGKEPRTDTLLKSENSDILVEVNNKINEEYGFKKRLMAYLSATNEMLEKYEKLNDADKKSICDMVDFLYNKNEKA